MCVVVWLVVVLFFCNQSRCGSIPSYNIASFILKVPYCLWGYNCVLSCILANTAYRLDSWGRLQELVQEHDLEENLVAIIDTKCSCGELAA